MRGITESQTPSSKKGRAMLQLPHIFSLAEFRIVALSELNEIAAVAFALPSKNADAPVGSRRHGPFLHARGGTRTAGQRSAGSDPARSGDWTAGGQRRDREHGRGVFRRGVCHR